MECRSNETAAAAPDPGVVASRAPSSSRSDSGVVVLVAVAAAAIQSAQSLWLWWSVAQAPPTWTGVKPDLDTYLIHEGLVQHPALADTLTWWTGPWVMGPEYPFYRPLTSLLFWLEWKAFGDFEWAYRVPGALAHVAAAVLFALLVQDLARRWGVRSPVLAGSLAAVAFVGFLHPYRWAVSTLIAGHWKNQPDSFAACACFLSMRAYLRAQDSVRGALPAAVVWYLVGCGFKEIAVFLPAAFLALELPELTWRDRSAWRRVASGVAAGVLFLGVRWACIRGLGYTYGGNRVWFQRTVQEGFGPFGAAFIQGEWFPVLAAAWLLAAAWGWRRFGRTAPPPARIAAVLLAVAGLALLGELQMALEGSLAPGAAFSPEAWLAGLAHLTLPGVLFDTLGALVVTSALVYLVLRLPRALLLGGVWIATSLAILVVSPGPVHRYYLPQCGGLLMLALAGGALLPAVASTLHLTSRRPATGAFRQ
jgi:hypothetical protein